MFNTLSSQVTLTEVGPRDGFQFEAQPIPTAFKVELIRKLFDAGMPQLQVTAFVNPQKVPQMADAEALLAALPRAVFDRVHALVLNPRGLERAIAAGLRLVEVSLSASDTHGRKNAGIGYEQALTQAQAMVTQAHAAGLAVRVSIQCAFGCAYEGRISMARVERIAQGLAPQGLTMLALADTTGMAHPRAVADALERIRPVAGSTPLALHLHDTRGLGLVNLLTALNLGVRHFDTSLGGMGGCPFIPRATGNIATEDTLNLLHKLGIDTGVALEAVVACARHLARFLAKDLPGRMHKCL